MTEQPLNVLFTWQPESGLERISEIAGVRVKTSADHEEILRIVPEADVLCVGDFDPEILSKAHRLRWVQALMGGVESVLIPELRNSPIPLTCCKECFAAPAAEHALAMMLAFTRRLEYDIRRRPHRTFEYREPEELVGRTVGIIGTGNLGREIAGRCRCFGMRVWGSARRQREIPEFDAVLPVADVLEGSDFVVVAVPLTPETLGLMGRNELRRMKPSAYLIDISGRPALYDLEALASALRENRIAGAALQMAPPDDSPLWDLENLLLSFHRSTSQQEVGRCFDLFADNLRRFQDGEPLRGLVDKQAGY